MRTLLYIFTLFFVISCNYKRTTTSCACCAKTFTTIDSALQCGSDPKNYKSLLFALVKSDLKANQKKGWEILGDPDIIEIAKRDYILIIIDPKEINLPQDNNSKQFRNIINTQEEETIFVVTNRVFYPFREFSLATDKEKIISDLGLGEGP